MTAFKTRVGFGFFAAALACAAMTGCTGEIVTVSEANAALTFHLSAEGESLVLSGSPRDASYRATYLNPLKVERMTVAVGSAGRFTSTCTSGGNATACSDPPFFSRVVQTAAGPRLQVSDLHGVVVAERPAIIDEFPPEQQGAPEESTGSQPTDCDEVAGCDGGAGGVPSDQPSSGTASKNTPSGGDSSSTSSTSCDASKAALKQQFCDLINQNLAAHQANYVYDCSRIDSDPTPDRSPSSTGLTGKHEFGCYRDIVLPAEEQLGLLNAQAGQSECNMLFQLTMWGEDVRMDLYMEGICDLSPLVLDLDGDGVQLTSVAAGVRFDLLGNGAPVQSAWITGGDAFLVLDRNGNGFIDDASELFGNVTDHRRFADGFAALAELDQNGDGRIDAADAEFAQLRLWVDADHDGLSTPQELVPLSFAGITALELSTTRPAEERDVHGNRIPLVSRFVRHDGTSGALVDAFLRFAGQ
jgi:hypothetical protein